MADKRDDANKTAADRRGSDQRRKERRVSAERRRRPKAVSKERRSGKDRRRKGPEGERRKVERRINEYRLEPPVLEFINAVNEFKSVNQKPFPTWSEIYEIFISLGYRKG